MLSVKDLRNLVRKLPVDKFCQQLGPFALIQRPPTPSPTDTEPMGLPMNVAQTAMARPEDISVGTLSLLFQLEDLIVATLPPMSDGGELTVGRQPDCDLVLDDKSVSKRHAVLRWDEAHGRCTVQDLGSTNGTFLNASVLIRRETVLRDGDIVSFGDVAFWFLLTETLHARLSRPTGSHKLGARSG